MDSSLQQLLIRLEHLGDQFSELRDGVQKAVLIADIDPDMALARARKVLEYIVRDIYERRIGEPPGTRPLENLLQRLVRDGFFPDRLDAYASAIRKLGNVGTHKFDEPIAASDVYQSLAQLMPIVEWYFDAERPEALGRSVAPPRTVELVLRRHPEANLANPETPAIVPRGLRSFGPRDADFFLELLPGLRDKDGLPESVSFWMLRIEAVDEATFTVGLIYGPSGCGKSSLVKAGLLPKLHDNVISVYVEATRDETETRLLHGLQKQFPKLDPQLSLTETLALLRRGEGIPRGKKALVVIDQFEQWLHAHKSEGIPELVEALRQCDGRHVQCIVLARDDFWMATTRFFRGLDIYLLEGQNSTAIDLFPLWHARKVLAAFGRAYGGLPAATDQPSDQQQEFLDLAVAGLAEDGKLICVRLALFAEMMKNRPWTAATLREVGGAEGIGVAFLDETFSVSKASPEHRYHERAARAVLKALLPEPGADIKGHMRSYAELLEASGYSGQSKDFEEVISLLDKEVRLITPTDPEGLASEEPRGGVVQIAGTGVSATNGDGSVIKTTRSAAAASPSPAARYYQLTHDYLVPSLRKWLTRKQRETRRGRAELLLAERSSMWNVKPENRFLPSLGEFVRILALTKRPRWTESQRRMMARTTRVRGIQAAIAAVLLIAVSSAGFMIRDRTRAARAEVLADELAHANVAEVPRLIDALHESGPPAFPFLKNQLDSAPDNSDQHLYAAVALLANEPELAERLLDQLFTLPPEQYSIVFNALRPYQAKVISRAGRELDARAPDDASEEERESTANRQAVAAVTLLRCGKAERVWPLLKVAGSDATVNLVPSKLTPMPANAAAAASAPPDRGWDPRVRSDIIYWLSPLGVDPQVLIDRLDNEPNVTIRRALILALGEYPAMRFATGERDRLTERMLREFESSPDAGLHAAAAWLLTTWNQSERLKAVVDRLRPQGDPAPPPVASGDRRWFVNSQGQTFAILDADSFMMGAPDSEPGRVSREALHAVHIGRRYAMAATPVTSEQYGRFQKEHSEIARPNVARWVRTSDSPQVAMTWYEAAAYCNWLSEKDGNPSEQQCYEPNDQGQFAPGMKAKGNYLHLAGYRLPTEAEWEFACRAGTSTSRYYGSNEMLLPRYTWYAANGMDQTHPVANLRPNDFGLFDMLGNVNQWCDDVYREDLHAVSDDLGWDRGGQDSGLPRVLRGGGFSSGASEVRSAFRNTENPKVVKSAIGFRPAKTLP